MKLRRSGKGLRSYRTAADRRRAVTILLNHGYNYFVGFRDVDPEFPAGLSFGKAEWAKTPYIKDVYYKGGHIIH